MRANVEHPVEKAAAHNESSEEEEEQKTEKWKREPKKEEEAREENVRANISNCPTQLKIESTKMTRALYIGRLDNARDGSWTG